MDVVAFTRQLVDIESITGNEGRVGDFLQWELTRLGFESRKVTVEGSRCNVWAAWPEQPEPAIVFSTHMDTVPPFIASREDDGRVYGRGSCDAKGIIAIQTAAALRLRAKGIHVGLLFLVGEERDSLGAKVANQQAYGSQVSDQRRAYGKSGCSGFEGSFASGGDGFGAHGALGLPGTGRVSDRQTGGGAAPGCVP